EGAEAVGLHVPDRFLGGVPQAVGVVQLHPAGVREQFRVGGPRHPEQFVGDVVVLVPDDQVGVTAGAAPVAGGGVGPVLEVALDDRVGRDRDRDEVALAGVVVDDDVHLRRAVAVDDVVGDAVERAAAVAGAVRAPVGVDANRSA